MGKITKDELSSSLNDHIDNQGNDKQDEIDSNLQTSDKTIVGAINELYQNINDGKALIANTIGEPLTDEDSFTTMSNGIKSLTSLLKTNLANAGVDVNDEEKLKSLISKVKGIVKENTSKGIKFAEGTGNWTVSSSVTISSPDLDFIPDIIICHFESLTQTSYYYGNYTAENTTSYKAYITNTSPLINTYNSASKLYISDIELGSFKLKMDSVNINSNYGNYWYISGKCIGWYAIKLDEKDNTLRDLLASILENKGVEVSPEDGMVSLITKVDSIKTSGGLDISIVESLPDTVTENKLCVIAPVTDGMIYVDRLDKDKAVSTYLFNTNDYFVRLVLSENTNTFVTTSTSGNVVERYLVGGIYRYDGSGLVLADNIYKGSNGKWVQIFDVLLVFSNGLQNDTTIVNSVPGSCKGYVSGDGTTLILEYLSTGATNIAFKNSLDITDYNKLVLVVESTDFSNSYSSSSRILFNLYDANTDTYIEDVGLETTVGVIDGWTKGQLIEIDVSSLKGPHYLRINKQAINIKGTIVLSEIYFTK